MNLDINVLLNLMYIPLMLTLPIIVSFCMLKMLKRMIIGDSYMGSSSFSSSVKKDTYSPTVNLNKSSYSNTGNKKSSNSSGYSKSSSSNSSNSDYLIATSLAASSYDSYDSSSSCSSSSYDSGSSSSYDSGSSCDSGGW
ncbi:RNA-binding protein [Bacillus mycoides]|uniref:RNA-binding protein n=2 Tax=Bacillus mycoides TaxID=1405 RepID=A0A4U3ADC3_BACMY|nr:RNA-binding protein [Bacillus mycoides]